MMPPKPGKGGGELKKDVQLPSGLIVSPELAKETVTKVRWTRDEFKSVARAAKFLGSQGVQMALVCAKCQRPINGVMDTADRVWSCPCTERRVSHGGGV